MLCEGVLQLKASSFLANIFVNDVDLVMTLGKTQNVCNWKSE